MGIRFSIESIMNKWHSNEEYSVLLLGTSLQINRRQYGEVRVASRRSRDHQVSRADGSLEGILLDLENMRRKILTPAKSDSRERLSMSSHKCEIYNVWSQQRDQGKREMLDAIRKFFEQVKRNFILYYSGHGEQDSGNWVIGKPDMSKVEVVTLDDILSLWQCSPSHCYKRLLIVSDSCYSGAWAWQLERFHTSKLHCNISMVASCRADQTCTDSSKGGDFTRYFLEANTKETPISLGFNPTSTTDLNSRSKFCSIATLRSRYT